MDNKLTLRYEEFQCLCEDFIEKSQRLGDVWELRKTHCRSAHQPQHYFVKKCSRPLRRGKQEEERERVRVEGQGEDLLELAGDTSGLSEDSDVAALRKDQPETDICVQFEYHIVHNLSFQVPVLYFNAAHSNGQPLSLADIWDLLSPELVSPDMDRWRLVTQQEHPYLGRPFYHIHPCHTSTVMGKAMQCATGEEGEDEGVKETSRGNYLVTWLSTFAPVVGLELSLEYAHR